MEGKRRGEIALTRREMLELIGATGIIAVVGCGDDDGAAGGGLAESATPGTAASSGGTTSTAPTASATATAASVACVITPELTEGPYFVDERLNRSDIRPDPVTREIKEGVPLRLGLTVSRVDESCTPLAGAVVDMWHCDALGVYSDVSGAGRSDTTGQKFLRGYQVADGNGAVEFLTIYPGWYSGRTIHIHFKVRIDPDSPQGFEFTSQMFFDEAVTDAVMARSPYSQKGSPDVRNASDNIFDNAMVVPLTEDGDGYSGTFHVGVNIA